MKPLTEFIVLLVIIFAASYAALIMETHGEVYGGYGVWIDGEYVPVESVVLVHPTGIIEYESVYRFYDTHDPDVVIDICDEWFQFNTGTKKIHIQYITVSNISYLDGTLTLELDDRASSHHEDRHIYWWIY